MFGYAPFDALSASVWMLSTDELEKYKKQFVRESKSWINDVNSKYRVLFNIVDARNIKHVQWLRAMGFVFIRELIHGPESRLFLEFVRIKNV